MFKTFVTQNSRYIVDKKKKRAVLPVSDDHQTIIYNIITITTTTIM